MDYDQARVYLTTALTYGINMGLHRINRLLELLGQPQKGLRCIHIAGTNGKGSVSSYCATILAAGGHRVGVFTSPYLVRLTERIRVIDGREGLTRLRSDESAGEIEPEQFAAAMTEIRAAVEQMTAEGMEHPTEFELITAAGFWHFARQNCDLVVLETGLGGRLDSTNVIEAPLACVITALGFDHMDRLGSTMREIAAEKAGIIKPGCPVFLYNPRDLDLTAKDAEDALSVVNLKCQEQGASLQLVSRSDIHVFEYGWTGQVFSDFVSGLILQTSLLGIYQPLNATLAARVCQTLELASDDAIREGVALARWPARLEILRRHPPIILDGAHNPQGCRALAATLARLLPAQPVVFLAGMLQDKDYEIMLRIILESGEYRPLAFICVKPDNPRALPAEKLAESVRIITSQLRKTGQSGYNVVDAIHAVDKPADGTALALQLAGQAGAALCAFGSLYMAGSIRSLLSVQEEQLWTGKN